MRHILTYLLLSLAIFQCCASLLMPLAQLGMARKQASVRLRSKSGEEEIFVLKKSDFTKERSGQREWWHAGQLYDLKHVEMRGDSAYVTALADAHEQWILDGFQQLFGTGNTTTSPHNSLACLLVQLLAQPFLTTDYTWTLKPPATFCSLPQIHFFQKSDLVGFHRIFSPPPEVA